MILDSAFGRAPFLSAFGRRVVRADGITVLRGVYRPETVTTVDGVYASGETQATLWLSPDAPALTDYEQIHIDGTAHAWIVQPEARTDSAAGFIVYAITPKLTA